MLFKLKVEAFCYMCACDKLLPALSSYAGTDVALSQVKQTIEPLPKTP